MENVPSALNPTSVLGLETTVEAEEYPSEQQESIVAACEKARDDWRNNISLDLELAKKYQKSLIDLSEFLEKTMTIIEKIILGLKQDQNEGKHIPRGRIGELEELKSSHQVWIKTASALLKNMVVYLNHSS